MSGVKKIEHGIVFKDETGQHCENQVMMRTLKSGEVVAVWNEERFPFHHDTGQTVFMKSKDGVTWDPTTRRVVLPYTQTQGNWDCGICELQDGTLLLNLTICGFFKRGIKSMQPSWSSGPVTKEWGDWSWIHKLRGWLGTYVLKSFDGGDSWTEPIPVNVRPMKHAGCRSGCWQLPSGSILMGLYGRIKGYEEEGENESTRSVLVRSDDNGENWEYFSTLGYDPASIIDYEEPALLRLRDGRLVCFMRTHVNPSSDAANMVMTVSEDDGFSWSPLKWTNIWGFPAELVELQDGRYLMVYGYRKAPFGVRGIISEDGLDWDVKNEFVIREGGVPTHTGEYTPASAEGVREGAGGHEVGIVHPEYPGIYQHIGYPTLTLLPDGCALVGYHEWTDDPNPMQYVRWAKLYF